MVFRKEWTKLGLRSWKRHRTNLVIEELPRTYNDAVYPQIPIMLRSVPFKVKPFFQATPGDQLKGYAHKVTRLFQDERIVLSYPKAQAIRPHVERLIVEAMRNGDRHRPTMDLANFWLLDKSMIHKLFKVFVPRYENYCTSFTAFHRIGPDYKGTLRPHSELVGKATSSYRDGVCLEMKGNMLPPIIRPKLPKESLLTNILINGARHEAEEARRSVVEKQPAPPQ